MVLFLELGFIFVARVIDVSMATVRMLLIVKGRRLQAAVIGFFEVIVYIVALGRVVNSLDNPVNLLVYAFGFAAGNYVGIFLEEKLALGYIAVQVIPSENDIEIIEILRENGYGVTVVEGVGKNGIKNILNVYSQRKDLDKILTLVGERDPKAFTAIMDAKKTLGGYYRQQKGK
ncbi:DUF2179 domain-containing protein [Alkalicella caledoniensis]|uniref:UPF0316 protein HYG86_02400 n=1 Tax=Alkalicella caledoniensis TaxID=2731377 RepID=A0A7G9W4S4_ALKCA|nr:DUF2179 domain-containing protein [Alkalicella caledoniensis]QNO13686.1 DUF2179 domain-containing protein [Alkalicella caledoniensis]